MEKDGKERQKEINETRGIESDTQMVENVYEMMDMYPGKNVPVQSRKNCITVLGMDPRLSGRIKYNTLSRRKNVVGELPWNKEKGRREWTNIDTEYLLYYMETFYHLKTDSKVLAALEMIADTYKFNPFIDMLNSVQWDGAPRIENLLPDFLGVEKSTYTTECMKLMMLAVISRAFSPGTKFDYVLVLTGAQGIGKSTFFLKLIGDQDWYLENMKSIYNEKDAAEKLQGKLIVEFNELLAMRSSIETVKAFTTTTTDDYRGAYQRESERRPRTCVFVGTTNNPQFLNDRTGNRRFLPIACGIQSVTKSLFTDEKELSEYFRQAWAEAYTIYKSGKFSLVLPKNLQEYVEDLQSDFAVDDPKVGMIQDWLNNLDDDYVCNVMISKELFGVENPDRKFINEITDIMNNKIEGWDKKGTHRFAEYGKQKCFKKNGNDDGNDEWHSGNDESNPFNDNCEQN